VVKELAPLVKAFGVANLTEAAQIAAIVEPERIYILGTALPEERKEIARCGFVPVISSYAEAKEFEFAAGRHPLAVTVAIDTGMGRLGIHEEDVQAEVAKIAKLPHIQIKTVATHLPVADEDDAFTKEQLKRFAAIITSLRAWGAIGMPVVHALNSAGAIRHPWGVSDIARIGLALYGSSPVASFQSKLRAVLTLKTRVTIVRDVPAGHSISYGRTFITPAAMRVATLAIGYADGYQRRLSGQGAEALIGGRRCPVLGRVTMDQIMVDVTALPEVEAGAEAVLLGRQGGEEILAADLARKAGTIAWEIFTGISSRVERIYLHSAGGAEESAPA
jgi:alanine racemase